MSDLQVPQRKLLNLRITEISNGFLVTEDGKHTFVSSYEEALMSLPAPQSQSKAPASRSRKAK